MKKLILTLTVAATFAVIAGPSAQAANPTWGGTSTGSDWNTAANWTNGIPVGGSTTLFNGGGNVIANINGSNATTTSLTFSGGIAYTITSSSGGVLNLVGTGAGVLSSTASVAETVNAPIIIGTSAGTDSYTFGVAASDVAPLIINGTVTGFGGTGSTTLTLKGASTVVNQINGAISDGGASDLTSIAASSGIWALTGTNTYTGGTTLSGGTLQVIGSISGGVTLASGTLQIGTANSLATGATISTTGGTISAYNAPVAITNNITQTAAGTTTFGGIYNFTTTGTTTLFGGTNGITDNNLGVTTLGAVNLSQASGGTAPTTTITAGSGASLILSGAIGNGSGGVTAGNEVTYAFSGLNGLIALNGANTYGGTGANTKLPSANATDDGSVIILGSGAAFGNSATFSGTLASGNDAVYLEAGVNNLTISTPFTTNAVSFNGSNNLILSGAQTGFTSGNLAYLLGTGTLEYSGAYSAAGAGHVYYAGPGNLAFTSTSIVDVGEFSFDGPGTVTFSDNAAQTGSAGFTKIDLTGGTAILDYTGGFTSVIANNAGSFGVIGGVTIEVNGGSGFQAYNPKTVMAGQTTVKSINGGSTSEVIQMGALAAATGDGFNFVVDSSLTTPATIATSTRTNTGSIMGGDATVTDSTGTYWAVANGATTAISKYTTVNVLTGSGDSTVGNYTATASTAISDTTINSLNFAPAASGNTLTLNSNLALGTGGLLFNGANNGTITGVGTLSNSVAGKDVYIQQYGAGILTINSVIADNTTTNLTKDGPGKVVLGASNTYTGQTYINQGTVSIASDANLNANDSALNLDGGILEYSGSTGSLAQGGNNRAVNLYGNGGTFQVDTAGVTLTVAGTIVNGSGTNNQNTIGSLTKTGAGTLFLTGTNTYSGGTYINAGILQLGNASALGATAAINPVNINTGTLDLDGFTPTTGPVTLTGGGSIINTGAAASLKAYNFNMLNGTVSAILANDGTNPAPLTKNSDGSASGGTVTLSAANTYTGPTSVNAGTLNVTGSLNSASVVTVGNNTANVAVLSGTGTVGGSVFTATAGSNVAYIAPGVNTVSTGSGSTARTTFGNAGTLTISGNLSLGTGTNLDIDLSSSISSGNDLIAMSSTGTLTIGGTVTVNINALSGTLALGSPTSNDYTIIGGAGANSNLLASNFTASITGSADTAHFLISGNNLEVYFTGATATNGAYTLATTVTGGTLLHANGGTTTLGTTIKNTGSGTQDTLNYSALTVTPGSGSVTGVAASGTALALGATSSSNSQTYTAGSTLGTVSLTPTASSVTNTNDTGETPVGTTSATSVSVYSGLSVWNTNGGGTWGTSVSDPNFGVNWGTNQGSPGVTTGFNNTDTATFDNTALTAGNSATVTLDGATPSLKAITFNTQAGSGYTLAQGSAHTGSIALNGNGGNATVTVSSGTHTISAPVSLTTGANVNVATGQQLTFSGAVSGTGGLNNTGAGTTIVTANNSYSGGTAITAGKFYVNNTSGSGTGTDGVTVSSGATLAGSGTIAPTTHNYGTGVTLNSGASLVSGGVQVANGGAVTGTGMKLDNTAGLSSILTVNGANLTFALGTNTTAGTGSYNFNTPSTNSTFMTVTGNTTGEINFAAGSHDSVTIMDVTSGATLALRLSTPYQLITAGLDSDYANLVIATGTGANTTYSLSNLDGNTNVNGWVVGVWTGLGGTDYKDNVTAIAINQVDLTGLQLGNVYPAPALYLNNGDLEVVPEPGTWALMLGGLALLVFIQRRRNKLS